MKENIINVLVKKEAEIDRDFEVKVEISKQVKKLGNCQVLFNREGESPSIIQQMKKEESDKIKYSTKVQLPKLGTYYFFFILEIDGKKVAIKISRATDKPFFLKPEEESPYWSVLVTQQDLGTPDWAKDKIVYQIFVDRFNKAEGYGSGKEPGRNYRIWGEMPDWRRNAKGEFHNNDFFCGNIKGIIEKIPYFKSLSVGILYLSPINECLYRYERYASTNHMKIDPDAGTFEDLKELHEKANENGIKVSSIYNQNIQVGANGEKIAELKDSSAVILNNYTLKQLQPFIEKYIINKFQNLTQKFEKIGFDELAPKIKLEVISTIGSSFISTNGDGITEKIINGIWIFATDYAQKNSIINDKLNNNEAEAQKILKTYISADGSRNISATNLNKIYEVLIEHNSIMSKEDLIMVNGETSIKKIEEYKKNIDIGKTYKIQIKAYKTNGAISEIEVKENEMKTNLIEENAQE